jgi:nicotinamidase-related amidase
VKSSRQKRSRAALTAVIQRARTTPALNLVMKKIIITIVSLLVLGVVILAVNYVIWGQRSTTISEGKPIVQRETKKPALLVIDIQEGITGTSSTSEFYVRKAEDLISVVNRIIDSSARHDIPVIYVKNEISNPLINILNSSLASGSLGAELDSRLKVISRYIVNKDKSDAFSNPLLDTILVNNEINRLVIVGLDLAECVKSTIEAAENRGYDICLISDALVVDPDSLKDVLLDTFKQRGCEIVSSNDYVDRVR